MELKPEAKKAIVIHKGEELFAVIDGKHYRLEELTNGDFDDYYETDKVQSDT